MISTRACGGHKITSATSWLKQLVALFVEVQFSFGGKSIQFITKLRKHLCVKQLLIPLEGSPQAGSVTFPEPDNRLTAFVLNYPFWTKTAPLRKLSNFPQTTKELLNKWTPPALGKISTGKRKKPTWKMIFFTAGIRTVKLSHCFYITSFLLGSGYIIKLFLFSARRQDLVLQAWLTAKYSLTSLSWVVRWSSGAWLTLMMSLRPFCECTRCCRAALESEKGWGDEAVG